MSILTGGAAGLVLSYVLGYSRRQYPRFTDSQDMTTLKSEHVRAFDHLGGAAAECLYDNMKTVVDRWEDGEPIYNTRFLAFATHCGFRPRACRPARPQTKDWVACYTSFVFWDRRLARRRGSASFRP